MATLDLNVDFEVPNSADPWILARLLRSTIDEFIDSSPYYPHEDRAWRFGAYGTNGQVDAPNLDDLKESWDRIEGAACRIVFGSVRFGLGVGEDLGFSVSRGFDSNANRTCSISVRGDEKKTRQVIAILRDAVSSALRQYRPEAAPKESEEVQAPAGPSPKRILPGQSVRKFPWLRLSFDDLVAVEQELKVLGSINYISDEFKDVTSLTDLRRLQFKKFPDVAIYARASSYSERVTLRIHKYNAQVEVAGDTDRTQAIFSRVCSYLEAHRSRRLQLLERVALWLGGFCWAAWIGTVLGVNALATTSEPRVWFQVAQVILGICSLLGSTTLAISHVVLRNPRITGLRDNESWLRRNRDAIIVGGIWFLLGSTVAVALFFLS